MKKFALLMVLVLALGLFSAFSVSAEAPARVGQRFDFDGSRGRTTADAILLLRHIDGRRDEYIKEGEGDVNGDGKTSLYDAVCFIRLLLNDTFTLEDTLKIATYNIKAGYYENGKTLPTIATMLKDVDADIIGLQEVDYMSIRSASSGDQLKYLAEQCGYEYYHFAPVILLGNGTVPKPDSATENLYGHGILSKYPIKFDKMVYFDAQGTNENGGPTEIRAVARYEIEINGKTVAWYNTHLNGDVGRIQYQQVQDEYMVYDQYAVFTADMNEKIPELEGYLNEDRFEILTDNSKIDHIIVSNDTIGWYIDENGNSDGTVASYETEPFTYSGKTVKKCSDHDLWYAHIYLKDE